MPHFRALNYSGQKAQKCERTFAQHSASLVCFVTSSLYFFSLQFSFLNETRRHLRGALFFPAAKLVADKRPQRVKKKKHRERQPAVLAYFGHALARRVISLRNNSAWPHSHCSCRNESEIYICTIFLRCYTIDPKSVTKICFFFSLF
jgi:hypothetical protein